MWVAWKSTVSLIWHLLGIIMKMSAAVAAEENTTVDHPGCRRIEVQKAKGSLASEDVCPCHLFLNSRFITRESGAPWDSQSPQAEAGYTSTSPTAVTMVTDARLFLLPPSTFCPSFFVFALKSSSAPPSSSHGNIPTFQPLWSEIQQQHPNKANVCPMRLQCPRHVIPQCILKPYFFCKYPEIKTVLQKMWLCVEKVICLFVIRKMWVMCNTSHGFRSAETVPSSITQIHCI